MSSRTMNIVTKGRISFFFVAEIPFYTQLASIPASVDSTNSRWKIFKRKGYVVAGVCYVGRLMVVSVMTIYRILFLSLFPK